MSAKRIWVKVASAASLSPNDMRGIKVGDLAIVVYNVDGTFYATGDVCTHAFALLSTGFLEGSEVECALHAGRFDVKTGKALCPPLERDLVVFPTRLVGDDIEVEIPVPLSA